MYHQRPFWLHFEHILCSQAPTCLLRVESSATPHIPSAHTSSGSSHQRRIGTRLITMKHCPQDILPSIFAMACNDGGFTARSLSIVSLTICEKSHYSRVHSIACYNVAQTLSFARILDSTPPHLRVVQHFLVCNSYKDNQPKPTSIFRRLPSIFSLIHSDHPSEPMQPYSGHRRASGQSCTLCVLTIIASTLHTLSLCIYWQSWAFLPLPSNFPALCELSINHQFGGGASTAAHLVRSSTGHHCNALLLQASVVS
jgi:hypothetical protein